MWTNEGPDLWLTADRLTIVDAGDIRAAFLLCAAGSQIPLDQAEKYGLTADRKAAADEKAKAAAANKLKQQPPANKGKGER